MARRDDSALSTALAIGVFIAVVATWLFIPPPIIRSAWQTERAEVYALAGLGEHLLFRQAMTGLQQSMAKDFQGFLLEADAMGEGALGNSSFSQWTRSRIEATWLWMGLVVYRLHVLMGWLLPGIPLAIVAYLDGQYVREIRKFSFVAQSPIRHKLGIRVMWVVLIGLSAWLLVPVPLPAMIAPTLTVAISYSLWLWVSNLQKRL
ncbi:MAG: DUF4400 domain-containing protein [Sterolibacterium sp.]|nr:DUF4400 domain-containing protein [Sterolibacterium sp.]